MEANWTDWHERPFHDPYMEWIQKSVLSQLPSVPANFNPHNPALRSLYQKELETKALAMRAVSEDAILQRFSATDPGYYYHSQFLDAVEALAALYDLTGETEYGRKAALILLGFYRSSTQWPVTSRVDLPPYHLDPNLEGYGHWAAKIWTTWYFTDLDPLAKLARAYDLLYEHEILQEVGLEHGIPDFRSALDEYFTWWWRVYTEYFSPTWLNMEQARIIGMIDYSKALGRPEWVRMSIRWFDRLLYRGYFRDGMWGESSPAYHIQVTKRLHEILDRLQGYTDPPGYVDPVDGDRIENLDAWGRWGHLLERANAALDKLRLPDGRYVPLNDSHYNTRGIPPKKSEPQLLPAAGVAVLGSGEGQEQFQLYLTFTATFGHEHKDALGIVLWAHGEELFSEGEYLGNRDWNSSTAAHNTVVVDQKNQYSRTQGPQMNTNWENPSVPSDDWLNRNAASYKVANLQVFDVRTPGLMMAEADAEALYGPPVNLYRRTVAAINRPEGAPYILDIFRVRGGTVHDWMLHGPVHREYTIDVDAPMEPLLGSFHTLIRSLESAFTTDALRWRIQTTDGPGVESILLPDGATTLIRGMGPAMRRDGEAPYLGVQRRGPQNTFVVVHSPYAKSPLPLDARTIEIEGSPEGVIAVEVTGQGFQDILWSTMDPPGTYREYRTREAGGLTFSGRFGWLRLASGEPVAAAIVGGGRISLGSFQLEAEPDYTGRVLDVKRSSGRVDRAGGEADQDFIDVEGALPEGDALHGRLIVLIVGDGTRHASLIDRVERRVDIPGTSRVYLLQDPGIEMAEHGAEFVFFPNWSIDGPVSYEVLGRGDWTRDG